MPYEHILFIEYAYATRSVEQRSHAEIPKKYFCHIKPTLRRNRTLVSPDGAAGAEKNRCYAVMRL